MARRAPDRLAATVDEVRAAVIAQLDARPDEDGTLRIPNLDAPGEIAVVLRISADGDGCLVAVDSVGRIDIPFFGWFFRPMARVARRRACAHATGMLRHLFAGEPIPPPARGVIGLPMAAFTREQATLLASASAAIAVAGFGSALFGQLADPISATFDASDATLANVLVISRLGALIALIVALRADQRGRRRALLTGVIGSAFACAVSAAAPTLAFFAVAQVFQRGFIITTAIVAGITVIEEAPEGARAYSASMLGLAGGLGFSLSVATLPIADLGDDTWRLAYVIGACSIVFAFPIARHLAETTRYERIVSRTDVARGRIRELFDVRYRSRFLLLALVGFLTNVFNAPSSQLMNKYLSDVRDYSNSGIALFRLVTTALPGLVGLLVGGRLAEVKGRRSVAISALLIATVTQMVFFVTGGPVLWVMSAVSVFTSAAAGVALGTLDAELFPTEARGTSNGLLACISVVGSMAGLGLAGQLSDPLGHIGRGIALCGIGALVAAILFVPRLPETRARDLDDVSPSERRA
ncbi:MAG: MFS transporter [Actinomycetota bacterium]